MNNLMRYLQKSYRVYLPVFIVLVITLSTVIGHDKYWPLQPLWKVYLFVYLIQFIGWFIVFKLENDSLEQPELVYKKIIKTAYVIGLSWSIIQIVWLGQWWTWLNLISQPFIYALLAFLFIKLRLISIDQLNKIRHHNDG